jgi:minor tail protein
MAQASTIGALRIVLGADTASFSKDIDRARGRLGKFSLDARKAGAVIGAALGTAAVGIAVAVKGALNAADELAKSAQKIGVPVDELSRLAHAANLSGVEFSSLETAFTRLSRNMADVAAGSGAEARRAFEALGVEVKNADGSLRSSSEVMSDVADKFAAMEDGTLKTAAATQIFGRAGADLIPMLNQGRDGLQAMKNEADALGIVIDSQTGAAAERFNDNLTRLGRVWDGFVIQVSAALAGPLAELTDWTVDSIQDTNELTGAHDRLRESVQGLVAFVMREIGSFRELSAEIATLQKVATHFGEGEFMAGWAAWHENIRLAKERSAELEERIAALNSPLTELSASVDTYIAGLDRAAGSQGDVSSGQARLARSSTMTAAVMGATGDAVEQHWRDTADSTAASFGQISGSFGSASGDMAKAGKAFGVLQATISMFTGAAKALELPFPANLAAMGAVLAQGASLVASIKSQKVPSFAHGGEFTVGGAPGMDNNLVAMNLSRGERVTIDPPGHEAGRRSAIVELTLNGHGYSRNDIRNLAEGLNEYLGDGGKINVKAA